MNEPIGWQIFRFLALAAWLHLVILFSLHMMNDGDSFAGASVIMVGIYLGYLGFWAKLAKKKTRRAEY